VIFQILLEPKPLGDVAYPTFAKAAAVWKESGRHGSVVELSLNNQIVRKYSAEEVEKASEVYMSH
jgi:hypothetical protein